MKEVFKVSAILRAMSDKPTKHQMTMFMLAGNKAPNGSNYLTRRQLEEMKRIVERHRKNAISFLDAEISKLKSN